MSSIGQGPVSTDQSSAANQAATGQVDYSDDSVKRGYSNQNSYSRTSGEEVIRSQVPKPSLAAPKPNAESDAAAEQVLKDFENNGNKPLLGSLPKSIKQYINAPLSKEISALAGKKADLQSQGFSETQIEAITSLANPDDENNSLSSMHSSSARVSNKLEGDGSLDKLFNTFTDVVNKYSSIKSIPPDLQAELDADMEALTKAAFNGKQPLDIDSATTMLVQIQTKLQDNRIQFDQENIKIGQVAKEQAHERQIGKIREMIEKVKKAEKTALIGKIFGWIAVAVMAIATVIVAAVGAVFTGGALTIAAISMMVAATAIVMTMMISQESGGWMMEIFDSFAGDDKKGARIAAMVFWTAIIIALSAGAAIVGGAAGGAGAGGAAGSAAANTAATGSSAAATATATSGNASANAATTAAKIASIMSKMTRLLQLAGGAAMVADGGSSVATAVYTYQADTLRADAFSERALLQRIQQSLDDALEAIQTAIDELQSGYSVAANIIKANHDTKTTLSRNLRA